MRPHPFSLSRMALLFAAMLFTAVSFTPAATSVATAQTIKDFDVTGSLDCGVRSGDRCQFADWEIGPKLAMFTEDISGETMRFEVDASWLRDDLTAFRQDDFVWFVVRDGIAELPVIVSVVEHRCHDGRYPQGQVARGLSTRDACETPG
ncbi:MAG: hypothetical protein AB7P40_22930 [Chloroflexota bacterium]